MTPEDKLEMSDGCLVMIAEALEEFGCCHGHDGKATPPMMYPEWIACIIRHHILAERERCAGLPEPPARWLYATGEPAEDLTLGEVTAYSQAWSDYAAAISEEPKQ